MKKNIKDFDKNKELSYPRYEDVYNLDIWAMSQKLPLDCFKWFEKTS